MSAPEQEPLESRPVSIPSEHEGGLDACSEGAKLGHDRRPSGSNQRWRHVRSGIVACVVYVAPDKSYLYTDASGTAWPMEMFLARWERT